MKRGVRGYDGGKKVSGRKRHILVDTTGLVITLVVHPADITDRDGARLVLGQLGDRFPRLQHVWADAGYRGAVREWAREQLGLVIEIVNRPRRWFWEAPDEEPPTIPRGFQVLPRRWVVERTFAWIGRHRQMSRD